MTESELEARLDALESHNAITRLIADYGHAYDNQDIELLASIWHDDARFDAGSLGVDNGRDAILGSANEAWKEIPYMHHWMTNLAIDIEGDTATAVVALDCFETSVTDGPAMIGGKYFDRFERRDGVWKFVERRLDLSYSTPMSSWTPSMGSEAKTAAQ